MAIVFPNPTELRGEYLTILKSLKPEVNTAQTDSDWFIRGQVLAGVISGMYADQRKLADDAFPQSARREALQKHLNLYFGRDFNAATNSMGEIAVTGTNGANVPIGTEFLYQPNGNVYQAIEAVTLVGTTGAIPVQSVSTGQSQNLLAGATLSLSSPPSGINNTAAALTDLSDGRDEESNEEASAAILNRIQQPPAGGTENDYKTWAKEADPSVVDVNVLKYIYGLGTVGVIFTAGTTDVDSAINNGEPIIRVPSDALVDTVREYVDALNPLTDCVFVEKPEVVYVPVTIKVRYREGNGATVPAGQTLTQEALVVREVKRAIYKTPPGGRRFGASGFVLASEIEEVVDAGLSSTPYTVGEFGEIISDRQVYDLAPSGPNWMLTQREIAEPGAIVVLTF